MRKLIASLFIFSITFASAQSYQPPKKVQENKDDLTFTMKVNGTRKVDWRFVREFSQIKRILIRFRFQW